MLDHDHYLYMISLSILIVCLLDNEQHGCYREKLHVNHFEDFKD